MTKRAKRLLAICVIIFAVIQFVGSARTNPPVVESHTIRSQLQMPPQVADILTRACMDCHSHETRWPWYSGVAPVRWWLVNHVNAGRNTLNFSEWTQYQPSFAIATLGAMGEVVKRDLMPLASYQRLHPDARLSKREADVFFNWAQAEKRRIQKILLDGRKTESR